MGPEREFDERSSEVSEDREVNERGSVPDRVELGRCRDVIREEEEEEEGDGDDDDDEDEDEDEAEDEKLGEQETPYQEEQTEEMDCGDQEERMPRGSESEDLASRRAEASKRRRLLEAQQTLRNELKIRRWRRRRRRRWRQRNGECENPIEAT